MKKEYQPSVVWMKMQEYMTQHDLKDQHPQLFIYLTDKPGAFFMTTSKLYWDDKVGDGYFGNTDPESLWESKDQLAEMQLIIRGKTISLGDFNEFMEINENQMKTVKTSDQAVDNATEIYPEHTQGQAVSECIENYAAIRKIILHSLKGKFPKNELMAMLDQANGVGLTKQYQHNHDMFIYGLQDGEKFDGTLTKWDINLEVLEKRIRELSEVQVFILQEEMQRQWYQYHGQMIDDFVEGMKA